MVLLQGSESLGRSVRAFVALGSNLGDRDRELARAVAGLAETPGIEVLRVSRVYETDPVGPDGQDPYLNAVAEIRCVLTPRALLESLLDLEARAGRDRRSESVRWGPRLLDLDLLLYGETCVDEPGLAIPHPRLHERAFVLEPLCELASELVHPGLGEPLSVYAAKARDPLAVRRWPIEIPLDPRPAVERIETQPTDQE